MTFFLLLPILVGLAAFLTFVWQYVGAHFVDLRSVERAALLAVIVWSLWGWKLEQDAALDAIQAVRAAQISTAKRLDNLIQLYEAFTGVEVE